MPKLLQINSTLNWGSTGRIAEHIGLLAQSKGWDCYLAHGARFVRKSSLKDISVGNILSEYSHVAYSMIMGRHGLGSKKSTKKFIKKIEEVDPDVIHLHNIHGYYVNYQVLFEWLSQHHIPVVWTLHDCWTMTGHCAHFDTIGCEKWKTGCYSCPLLNKDYKSLFFDRSKSNYDLKKKLFTSLDNVTIVTVSKWLKGIVQNSFLGKYPIKVIHNGIDLSVFKPSISDVRKRLNIPKGKMLLLGCATGWGKNKGLEYFQRLSENESYQVVLVGVTPKIKKQLSPNIISILRTSDKEELAELYSIADVLINPTLCDSFPTVNLEALACGTPVITFRTGGSPEAVDTETGIVVEKGDYQGLIDAIESVKESGKLAYSQNCRRRAELLFDKENCFNDYIDLYNSLI